MDLGIGGKTALVTAASKGSGLGAARALASEGCNVAAMNAPRRRTPADADRRATGANPRAARRRDRPVGARPSRRRHRGALRRARHPRRERGGPPPARALDLDDEAIAGGGGGEPAHLDPLVRAAVPHMRAAGWGRIVLITSFGVKQPIPTLAASNIARTGLWAWAKTAAADLVPDGITLNALCPGMHATDRVRELGHTGRLGDPEDFGRVAAFLCSRMPPTFRAPRSRSTVPLRLDSSNRKEGPRLVQTEQQFDALADKAWEGIPCAGTAHGDVRRRRALRRSPRRPFRTGRAADASMARRAARRSPRSIAEHSMRAVRSRPTSSRRSAIGRSPGSTIASTCWTSPTT